ncbi:hypothetical protein KM760_gp1 [Ivy ringspot-associated virus]|uniref:Uncharacterized protein n=1 Tax=Ivy ringspot-associated virus TaxID=2731270 RepID=A0A6M3VZH6_9VIRU|nr:hypothetical protein KM760_gp1 [Ivy ringspot-associated virus]QJF45518.1 hypothetical protein [Ivy ringspot-associated virus]
MSERWEKAILEWYEKSRTADLEYLDLSISHKVSLSDLANNIAVVYDRLNLHNRVHLKDSKKLFEELEVLKSENRKLRKELSNLTKVVTENQPITKSQVLEIAQQIALQPKEIEEQALRLTEDLRSKLERVETILSKVEAWTTS